MLRRPAYHCKGIVAKCNFANCNAEVVRLTVPKYHCALYRAQRRQCMFHGSLVALVTPMTGGGAVDEASLARLIDFHVDNSTDAIVAVGTTGESATLDAKEHCHVIRRTVELTAGRIPVIAGTGANSTSEAIDLTQCALEAGADACLLVTPYYNKPTQEGLFEHFKAIADAVPIHQILYNVPGRTACDMLPETVERLAKLSNIVGIKEATGDLDRMQDVLERCGDQIDVFSGDDATAMEAMLLGAKGNISVTANVAPKEMYRMCAAATAGRRSEAEAINAPLEVLHRDLFVESNPIPVKWALHEMGLISNGIRLPMTELDARYHETVRNALRQANVLG